MSLLEPSIQLYKAMDAPYWSDANISGQVLLSYEIKTIIREHEDDLELELEKNDGTLISTDNLEEISSIRIRFSPPRKEFCFFAKNINDYLSNFKFLYEPATEFYISDIDGKCKNSTTENDIIKSYIEIVRLHTFLSKIADHTDTSSDFTKRHIILTSSGKCEISVIYNSEDVDNFSKTHSTLSFTDFESETLSPPHKSSKRSFIKKSIYQHVSSVKDSIKFPHLVDHIEEVIKTYRDDYELFIDEFSFEDERDKLEKRKQEYITKLNDILSGIHSKLLAVPVSLVIVSGQMKTAANENYLVVNSIIFFGALMFAILMWMLTANQLHSLLAVQSEYLSRKKRMKLSLKDNLYMELEGIFEQLGRRFKHQRRMIRVVDTLVLIGLIFSLLVFEYHTKIIANGFWQNISFNYL